MSRTKYELDRGRLEKVAGTVFGTELLGFRELTAGLCNALYLLDLPEGHKAVLKAADPDKKGLRRGEQWLMRTEVEAMGLASRIGNVPVPEIYAKDLSGDLFGAPLFIMEYVSGQSMGEVARSWSPEEKDEWYEKIGELARRIASLHGPSFGIIGSGRMFPDCHSFFMDFLGMILKDADEGKISLGVETDAVINRLESSADLFNEVTEPRFVHYDLWENNLIIRNGCIAGVLDWERAVFADPLMEERFRNYALRPSFLKGYGKEMLSASETERCLWYDLAMDATLMVEVFYRQYEDRRQYERAGRRLTKTAEKLGLATLSLG